LTNVCLLCRRAEKAEARKSAHASELDAAIATYDAKSDPNSAGTDPMRTLFVSRLDYSITESDLYAEFEKHGAIQELKLIRNKDGKSRGYSSSRTRRA
jgi:U1 small nuclear ribonucleoprotein 70kDa